MFFSSFVGNGDVVRTIKEYIRDLRLPHAIIIEGPDGSGRRTLADCIAAAAVCRSPSDKPCGSCSGCVKAASQSHPDIVKVSGHGGPRSFHIDVIRQIRQDAYIVPNEASYNVFILAQANFMTEQAQNALLKMLEEPPRNVIFILTCNAAVQMLPTVVSRSVVFTLHPVERELAKAAVLKIVPGADQREVERAVSISSGLIGKAVELLSDGMLSRAVKLAEDIAKAATELQELPLLKLTASFIRDKELTATVLSVLTLIFRDALVRKTGSASFLFGEGEMSFQLSNKISKQQALAALEVIDSTEKWLYYNANSTLLSTHFCALLRCALGR